MLSFNGLLSQVFSLFSPVPGRLPPVWRLLFVICRLSLLFIVIANYCVLGQNAVTNWVIIIVSYLNIAPAIVRLLTVLYSF